MKFFPNIDFANKSFKINVILCFFVVFGIFYMLLEFQRTQQNPKVKFEELQKTSKIAVLANWSVKLEKCGTSRINQEIGKCSILEHEPITITLPNAKPLAKWKDLFSTDVDTARLSTKLSEETKLWISKQRDVYLVIPRSVHYFVRIRQQGKSIQESNFMGSSPIFSLNKDELLETGEIELEYNFDGYPWFGPSDLPVALTDTENAVKYAQLPMLQITMGNQMRNMEIGFPLLLAAIAIVLDHSMLFGFLSFFAGSRAIRSYVLFTVENEIFPLEGFWRHLFFGAQGLTFGFLVLFVSEICLVPIQKTRQKVIFLLVSFLSFLSLSLLDAKFTLVVDLWSDGLACLVSLPICFYGIAKFYKKMAQEKRNKRTDGSMESKEIGASPVVFYLRTSIVTVALAVHFWANFSDSIAISDTNLKDLLDIKHQVLFPLLIFAALLEVGSTAKKMLTYGIEMAEKAVLQKDLSVGKEVQRRMLPVRKYSNNGIQWRSFYIPATALAGDWYDIRVLQFAENKRLIVACVADVTGHGVGSSLATSVISSHWGLWCQRVEKGGFPTDAELKKALVKNAPKNIHLGLLALRNNEHSTAVFIMICPETGHMLYCCASHPGIMISDSVTFSYLFNSGSRLGAETGESEEASWEVQETYLKPQDTLLLFTDGIQPPGVGMSQWSSSLKRGLRKEKQPLLPTVFNQIRTNRKLFRSNKRIEDDMTLVAVSVKAS